MAGLPSESGAASSVRRRRSVMPIAAAITAAITSRTIGLKRMLSEESPSPEAPELAEPSGANFGAAFCSGLLSGLVFPPPEPDDVDDPDTDGELVPPVGRVVVPTAPEPDDVPPEECAPD